MAAQPPRRIEEFYARRQLQTAAQGRRLGGWALDALIGILTLGMGWLIWFAVVAPRGQTPGKALLGMYIMREDGTRAGGGYTWLREVVVKWLLFGIGISIISGLTADWVALLWFLAPLWCLWDRERQCLWDKITSTYVAYSALGFRPLTAVDLELGGEQPAATSTGSSEPLTGSPGHAVRGDTGDTTSTMPESSAADRLRELQSLRNEGLITGEQYEERRARILEDL